MPWLRATPLHTVRLNLEPLEVRHAAEMAAVLSSPELYIFTGGEPPTEDLLDSRYRRQTIGHSPEGDAKWLNWIIYSRSTRTAVGYVQATLTVEGGALVADTAWLVTASAQHRGIATEAAGAMLAWLRAQGVISIRALIHPDHHASAHVAQRLGYVPTTITVDGESLWELPETSTPEPPTPTR
ncbi:GNAT family N-acetyltransferase [Arthrobacter echini]|uniref:GNAT family N-acetyltransferase n=1 Tax=Arthrobacter echini TaxID=1529066 RepID=A0A5D0XIM8_9MICC|nr:GNAT family N-acetyltransferase [Arthrobacter echini]TYC96315.1 GNAT family N-acetyltransferase [Arthrobacter echini]